MKRRIQRWRQAEQNRQDMDDEEDDDPDESLLVGSQRQARGGGGRGVKREAKREIS